MPAKNGDVLELDELWSFVQAAKHGYHSGCGWLFVEEPVRSSPGRWATAACKAHVTCEQSLPEGYRHCATRSDFWEAYVAAFPRRTHRSCGKEEGETCHVERWFGTLRARLSRLVRRAYSFSKHAENHLDAIHLFITTYNLAILHKATVN